MLFMRCVIFVFLVVVGLMAVPPLYHLSQGNLLTGEKLPPRAVADAVMVFTGDAERIAQGYELYLDGEAEKIMVTGEDFPLQASGPEVRELSRHIRRDDINVDLEAKNTIENAAHAAEWAMEQDVESIVLVTSEDHMQRAFFELRRLLPDNVKLYTNPVPGSLNYSGLDSEAGRLLCRLYETTTDTSFCYQTRKLAQQLGM